MSARNLVAVRVEPELVAALDELAGRSGVTRSAAIRSALLEAVDPDVLRAARERQRGEDVRAGLERDQSRLDAINARMARRKVAVEQLATAWIREAPLRAGVRGR